MCQGDDSAIPNMRPAKAGQPYSAAINHVIVGQVLHSPALNEGHVLVNPPYLELLEMILVGAPMSGGVK